MGQLFECQLLDIGLGDLLGLCTGRGKAGGQRRTGQ